MFDCASEILKQLASFLNILIPVILVFNISCALLFGGRD